MNVVQPTCILQYHTALLTGSQGMLCEAAQCTQCIYRKYPRQLNLTMIMLTCSLAESQSDLWSYYISNYIRILYEYAICGRNFAAMVWVHLFPQGEGSMQTNTVTLTDHLYPVIMQNVNFHLKFLISILGDSYRRTLFIVYIVIHLLIKSSNCSLPKTYITRCIVSSLLIQYKACNAAVLLLFSTRLLFAFNKQAGAQHSWYSVQPFEMVNKVHAYCGSGQVKNIPVLFRILCLKMKYHAVCFETFGWF